jgi:CO/xanthine dehydrogenase Mo-binding subunit
VLGNGNPSWNADKTSGQAQFGIDVRLPGMLYGSVLRNHTPCSHPFHRHQPGGSLPAQSRHHGCRPARAEAARGEDRYLEKTAWREKVLYYGHAVAAVVAG